MGRRARLILKKSKVRTTHFLHMMCEQKLIHQPIPGPLRLVDLDDSEIRNGKLHALIILHTKMSRALRPCDLEQIAIEHHVPELRGGQVLRERRS